MHPLAQHDLSAALPGLTVAWVGTLAGLVTAAAALAGAFLARGSTAVPAAGWAVAAALALTTEMAAVALGGVSSPAVRGSLRLVAVALAVCPTMSLLGAKRPQHGVWQLIVATLAVVLMLPAMSATLIRPGSHPDVHLLERCFLLLLAVVGWMNFAGTRHALAATLLAAGQIALSWPWLPFAGHDPAWGGWFPDGLAAALLATGASLAAVQSAVAAHAVSATTQSLPDRCNRPFLALRETLGAAWTLRIAERFNAVATSRGWPCRLHFSGLEPGTADGPEGFEADAARAFVALLRRFVNTAWLARHGWSASGRDARGRRPNLGPFHRGAV